MGGVATLSSGLSSEQAYIGRDDNDALAISACLRSKTIAAY